MHAKAPAKGATPAVAQVRCSDTSCVRGRASRAVCQVAIVTNPPDTQGAQYIVLIDNVHCNIWPKQTVLEAMGLSRSSGVAQALTLLSALCTLIFFAYLALHHRASRRAASASSSRGGYIYNRVPSSSHEAQALMEEPPPANNHDTAGNRIPCLPHARLRPCFKAATKAARYLERRPGPSPTRERPEQPSRAAPRNLSPNDPKADERA